jgi:hypothetical protein
LERVEIFNEEGILELSIEDENGAIETGNSGSFAPIIIPGAKEAGEFLSPSENSLENLSLEITFLPSGRSSIGCP